MTSTRDYYEILSVTRTASAEEIKRSFYKLARQYHPDVNKEPDAATRFKEINEAYQVLSDPEKRASYDRYGKAGVSGNFDGGFGEVPLNDIFETIFGAGFGARAHPRHGPQPGAHLKTTLTLEFEEAVFGADKEISVPRLETCPSCKGNGAEPGTSPSRCPQCRGTGEVRRATQSIFGQFINVMPCPRCNGEGEVIATPCHECGGQKRVQIMRKLVVKVPAGVDEGTQIRLQAEGEAGTSGGPSGHLYVQIAIKPHPKFKRDNQDLLYTLPLNIAQAALGDEVTVPTLDGDEMLKIPAGTQHGKEFHIKNKGVPNLKRSGRGDLIVTTSVAVPTHLSEKQKALLREFARTLDPAHSPNEDKGILDQLKDVIMGS